MDIVVKDLNDPEKYAVWSVQGHTPENFVCEAPSDPNDLKELLEDLSSGKQDLIKTFAENPKDVAAFRQKALEARSVRDNEKIAKDLEEAQAKADAETKAQAILTKISAIKTLRNKSRTLAEHGQFIDSMFDLLFGDQAKVNIIEILTNGKAKG